MNYRFLDIRGKKEEIDKKKPIIEQVTYKKISHKECSGGTTNHTITGRKIDTEKATFTIYGRGIHSSQFVFIDSEVEAEDFANKLLEVVYGIRGGIE